MVTNNLETMYAFRNFLSGIILFCCSLNVNGQVNIGFSYGLNANYLEALISKAIIETKGENWYMDNIVKPIINGENIHYRHVMVVSIDGNVNFFRVKHTPNYIINALNEAAHYLEKNHSTILCPISFFSQNINLDDISNDITSFKSVIIEHNKRKQLEILENVVPTDSNLIRLLEFRLREVPIVAIIVNAWQKSSLITEYLSDPIIELSGITIMEYLKQEYDKILSQPLPKSTLDYGITNEDFWPIKEDDHE